MPARVVVVTGTSRGLGRDLAQHYAGSAQVVGLQRSDATLEHPSYLPLACDVSSEADVDRCAREVMTRFGRVDLVINNAAVLKSTPLLLMSVADLRRMIDVNLTGAMLVTRAFLRPMVRVRAGRIVNVLSMSHRVKAVGDSVYAATKAGLEVFAQVVNREVAGAGVTINNLAVSAYESGMLAQVVKDDPERVLRHIPNGRLAPLAEIVRALEFLADPAGKDVGAQTIYLGGVS
jgi:3-oxoacyl-[acyl-carrier protein] reductase